MKLMNRLERKFGKYGIPNLTLYVIIGYVIGYILQLINPSVLNMLSLNVTAILHGQVWRLITWVISPPGSSNVLFFIIAILFFYYPIGTSLERTWGTFRYTLYIFSGILFTVIGAFFLHFISGGVLDSFGRYIFSTYYISLSIFLAYALCYPDMQVLLYFVIPIKMKWMAYVYLALVAYDIISYIRSGVWFMAVPIIASLLNFLIFFLTTRDMNRYNPKEIKRKQQFKKAVSQGQATGTAGRGNVTKHKCAICWRTELDDPNLEFRFCSRCNGNYEYCQDHLFTHIHVK